MDIDSEKPGDRLLLAFAKGTIAKTLGGGRSSAVRSDMLRFFPYPACGGSLQGTAWFVRR